MSLQAEEKRIVIYCLNTVLQQHTEQLKSMEEGSEAFTKLSNDTALIELVLKKAEQLTDD